MKKNIFISVFFMACAIGAAAADEIVLSGEGTEASPYLISNAEDLDALHQYVGTGYADVHFALQADIDMQGREWLPVGSGDAFYGQLHGKGHAIKNLSISAVSAASVGFFAQTADGAAVDSLGFVNCRVEGGNMVGIIAGMNSGSISNCYVAGSVKGQKDVGGMVGINAGAIANAYSLAEVEGTENVGGVAGQAALLAENPDVSFAHVYVAGPVKGESIVGAFVGFYNRENIYTTCYFDKQRTGLTNAVGNNNFPSGMTGKNTTDMCKASCFTSGFSGKWDMETVWNIWEGNSYPFFRWQGAPAKMHPASLEGVAGQCAVDGFGRVEISNAAGAVLATVTELQEDGSWTAALQGVNFGDRLSVVVYNNEGLSPSYPQAAEVSFASGLGTEAAPFGISTVEEFSNLRDNLGSQGNGDYFMLEADLDLSTYGDWTPIGTQQLAFYGYLDGKGHVVRNLRVVQDGNYAGLFAFIGEEAAVSNLHVLGAYVEGNYYAGILAGQNKGTVSGCSVYGTVNAFASAGGIAGQHQGTMSGCYAAVKVVAPNSMAGGLTGNMIGGAYVNGSQTPSVVNDCYAHVDVECNINAGGLVGSASAAAIVYSSYCEGRVTEGNGSSSGALMGGNSSNNIGWHNDLEYPCYANADVCSLDAIGRDGGADALAELKSPAELKQQATYQNWNFEQTWRIVEGKSTPYFMGQAVPSEVVSAAMTEVKGLLPSDETEEAAADASVIVLDASRQPLQAVAVSSDGSWRFVPDDGAAIGDTLYVVSCKEGVMPSMAVPVVLEEGPDVHAGNAAADGVCALYPAVASEYVYVDLPASEGKVRVSLVDAAGRTMGVAREYEGGTTVALAVSGLPEGICFAVVETAQGRTVHKFMKR